MYKGVKMTGKYTDYSFFIRVARDEIGTLLYVWRYDDNKPFTGVFYNPYENKIVHCKNGLIHREDGPAVICLSDNSKYYYLNDVIIVYATKISISKKTKKFRFNKVQ